MTEDTLLCVITFEDTVPITMSANIKELSKPNAVEVTSMNVDNDTLQIEVDGFGASMAVFEKEIRGELLNKYPNADLEWNL